MLNFFIEMYFIYEIHPFKVYNVVILEYMLKVNWFWIFWKCLKRVKINIPLSWSSSSCDTLHFVWCSLDLSGVVAYVTIWHYSRIKFCLLMQQRNDLLVEDSLSLQKDGLDSLRWMKAYNRHKLIVTGTLVAQQSLSWVETLPRGSTSLL